jgi:hypothetical protein
LGGNVRASGCGGLLDCLNHERLAGEQLVPVGVAKLERDDADLFKVDLGCLDCGRRFRDRDFISRATDDPRGWTIPAEESKYWMMRRPAEFPDLGKSYNIEWTQFQGTAPMTQALAAGALDCATQAPLSLANGVVGGNLKAYIVAQHVFEKRVDSATPGARRSADSVQE